MIFNLTPEGCPFEIGEHVPVTANNRTEMFIVNKIQDRTIVLQKEADKRIKIRMMWKEDKTLA